MDEPVEFTVTGHTGAEYEAGRTRRHRNDEQPFRNHDDIYELPPAPAHAAHERMPASPGPTGTGRAQQPDRNGAASTRASPAKSPCSSDCYLRQTPYILTELLSDASA